MPPKGAVFYSIGRADRFWFGQVGFMGKVLREIGVLMWLWVQVSGGVSGVTAWEMVWIIKILGPRRAPWYIDILSS